MTALIELIYSLLSSNEGISGLSTAQRTGAEPGPQDPEQRGHSSVKVWEYTEGGNKYLTPDSSTTAHHSDQSLIYVSA